MCQCICISCVVVVATLIFLAWLGGLDEFDSPEDKLTRAKMRCGEVNISIIDPTNVTSLGSCVTPGSTCIILLLVDSLLNEYNDSQNTLEMFFKVVEDAYYMSKWQSEVNFAAMTCGDIPREVLTAGGFDCSEYSAGETRGLLHSVGIDKQGHPVSLSSICHVRQCSVPGRMEEYVDWLVSPITNSNVKSFDDLHEIRKSVREVNEMSQRNERSVLLGIFQPNDQTNFNNFEVIAKANPQVVCVANFGSEQLLKIFNLSHLRGGYVFFPYYDPYSHERYATLTKLIEDLPFISDPPIMTYPKFSPVEDVFELVLFSDSDVDFHLIEKRKAVLSKVALATKKRVYSVDLDLDEMKNPSDYLTFCYNTIQSSCSNLCTLPNGEEVVVSDDELFIIRSIELRNDFFGRFIRSIGPNFWLQGELFYTNMKTGSTYVFSDNEFTESQVLEWLADIHLDKEPVYVNVKYDESLLGGKEYHLRGGSITQFLEQRTKDTLVFFHSGGRVADFWEMWEVLDMQLAFFCLESSVVPSFYQEIAKDGNGVIFYADREKGDKNLGNLTEFWETEKFTRSPFALPHLLASHGVEKVHQDILDSLEEFSIESGSKSSIEKWFQSYYGEKMVDKLNLFLLDMFKFAFEEDLVDALVNNFFSNSEKMIEKDKLKLFVKLLTVEDDKKKLRLLMENGFDLTSLLRKNGPELAEGLQCTEFWDGGEIFMSGVFDICLSVIRKAWEEKRECFPEDFSKDDLFTVSAVPVLLDVLNCDDEEIASFVKSLAGDSFDADELNDVLQHLNDFFLALEGRIGKKVTLPLLKDLVIFLFDVYGTVSQSVAMEFGGNDEL